MDKHKLRQRILSATKYYGTETPVSIADLAAFPQIKPLSIPREEIVEECAGLAMHEYLRNCRPGREPLYLLTAKGLDQINQETTRDEFVWGELASFQR